ncbi:MAG: hypothetical protein KKG47_12700 [Proteobacteria bacterium]|nr:hypothetical protein [Pseudomonadota bacterium]MBU1738712.1 hypothetical protein [Pseudomonadota bacterium]
MIGRLIGEDIKINLAPADSPGNFMGDAGKLEQILMNLAVNARDAIPNGGEITISTRTVDLPEILTDAAVDLENHTGKYALLEFSDNGSGIPEELCDKIFEPFYTTKEIGHGTGLGLATTYGITRQHHGQINRYEQTRKRRNIQNISSRGFHSH